MPKKGALNSETAEQGKARHLGRISDAEWQEIQSAADAMGLTLTQWALAILLPVARKQSQARKR